MTKLVKNFIHYLIIYSGINVPIYMIFHNRYNIDLYGDFIYTVIFVAICVLFSDLIVNWYKLKD